MKKSELQQIIREEVRKVLNEELLDDQALYTDVVDILKTLYKLSGKIRFSVYEVNGFYNIVYDDSQGITKDILLKLGDRKFWNTAFTPSTAKFANNRVNIHFSKKAQEVLDIQNFDTQSWSPKSAPTTPNN